MASNSVHPTAQQQKLLDSVKVRLIRKEELPRWNSLIREHHYLHDETMVGRCARYVAHVQGKWLALLGWSSAAYRLKAREAWIGWTDEQRQSRLSMVAQNSRFLILPKVQCPNLASKVLALCAQRLSKDWIDLHGQGVLLCESFVDPERYLGTCYRAAGWQRLGRTKGYARAGKDYYVAHDRPKELWVLPLCKSAVELLHAPQLPPAYQAWQKQPELNSALNSPQLGTLLDLFWQMPEYRRAQGRKHRVGSVLACAAAGVMAGARTYADLATVAARFNQGQLRKLRTWLNPKDRRHEPPSESTFWRVLSNVDAQLLDDQLGCWLGQHSPPEQPIAVDGKTVRGANQHLFSAFLHSAQAVVSQQAVDQKTNEITCLPKLLESVPLEGKIVTADALHTQHQAARHIVQERGGEFVFTVKANQPTLRRQCENRLPKPAFSP